MGMGGRTVARLVDDGTTETITYTHQDHLGSAASATDASGTLLWREDYTPFGETRQNPLANANEESFTGHIRDTATGLTYMQARYYDPVIGRFLSNDPVGFAEGGAGYFNRYSYTANDPVNFWDPSGECIEQAEKKIGLCPTEGDQGAADLVEQQLANPNSLASDVNERAIEAGERIDVTTDSSQTTVTGSGYSKIDPGSTLLRAGEIVVGTQYDEVEGLDGMIEFTVEDAFEHEASHALDDLTSDQPVGNGFIDASGRQVILPQGRGAQEARAVNRTNRYRAAEGRPLRGGY